MGICTRCKLYETKINRITGRGLFNSKFLIIGESPSVSEDILGKPFVSTGNKLLLEIMQKAGFKIHECYFTYMVQCRACEKRSGPNRLPTEEEILACMPIILEEISHVNYQGVILIDKLVEKYYRARVRTSFVKIVSPNLIKLKGGRASNLYIDTLQKLERFHDKITGKDL